MRLQLTMNMTENIMKNKKAMTGEEITSWGLWILFAIVAIGATIFIAKKFS